MHVESNMKTYISMCKIDSQWEFAIWLGKLKQGLCINLEGWDGEGEMHGESDMETYDTICRIDSQRELAV